MLGMLRGSPCMHIVYIKDRFREHHILTVYILTKLYYVTNREKLMRQIRHVTFVFYE